MFRSLVLTAVLLFSTWSTPSARAQAAEIKSHASLTVTVTGLRNRNGQVFFNLWNGAEGFPRDAGKALRYVVVDGSKMVNGAVTATFSDLAPGAYAVSILHDENKNGKMDNNFVGMPKEGWAVSNNIVTHTHAPSFDQARISIRDVNQKIAIEIHY